MKLGRLFSFFFVVVAGGLLQLWLMFIMLNATGQDIKVSEVLGDGGMFFFATSLSAVSAISLFDSRPIRVGKADFNVTLLCCGIVIVLVVGHYSAVLSHGGFGSPLPFSKHVNMQLVCAMSAVVYWFYSGMRTGLFVPKENDAS